ncbi:hypothetical protein JW835_17080 [bacterium]|nr:hypothetical protein [bacterium]
MKQRLLFAEIAGHVAPERKCIIDQNNKYILSTDESGIGFWGSPIYRYKEELYNLKYDNLELKNVVDKNKIKCQSYAENIEIFTQNSEINLNSSISESSDNEELIKRLRSLGYIK